MDEIKTLLEKFNKTNTITTKEELINFPLTKCPEKPYVIFGTSGSTNKRAYVYFSKKAYENMVQRIVQLFELTGTTKEDIILNLSAYGQLFSPGIIIGDGITKLGATLVPQGDNHFNIQSVKEMVAELQPNTLYGYPNKLSEFFSNIPDHKIKKCYVHGEFIIPKYKKHIEEMSGVKIYNNYGSTEVGPISITINSNDEFQLVLNNLIVEVLAEDGTIADQGEGFLLVTDPFNYSMPIIKYKVGDIVHLKRKNDNAYIKIKGRKDDFVNIHGNLISIKTLCNQLFQILNSLNFFMTIEKNPSYKDILTLYISQQDTIIQVKELFKEYNLHPKIITSTFSVPKTISGKYNHFIDLRKKDNL